MLVRFWGFGCSADGGTPKTPKSHQPPPSPALSRPSSPPSLCALCDSVVKNDEPEAHIIALETGSLTDRTSRAAVWVSAQMLFTKVASLLSQILLAKFLLKEDFGLYALAMTVYSFAALLHQAGIQEVLIKRQRAFRVWANAAFWMSLATGVLACLVTIAFAPVAVGFYANVQRPAELTRLIMVISGVFPLAAAGAVSRARLQIDLRFRELAVIGTINMLLDLTLKVVLAWLGFGAFSFGYAMVVVSAVYLGMSLYLAPVRLRWTPQLRRWRYLVGDGLMVIAAMFFYWLIEEGDYIVLGRFETDAVVGLYFFAYKISKHTMTLLTHQISKVLFPALSRLPSETGQQLRAFVRASRMVVVFSIPCCVAMAATAEPLVKLFFEPRWYAAIPLVQIMCLGMSLRAISWPAASLIQAQGRFRTRMVLAIISVFVFFPATIIGTRWGSATGLAIAVALFSTCVALVDLATALWPGGTVVASISRIFTVPILANLLSAVPGLVLANQLVPGLGLAAPAQYVVQIAVFLIVASTIYLVLVRVMARDVFEDAQQRLTRLFRTVEA